MSQATIFLFAGHDLHRPGASAHGWHEHKLVIAQRDKVRAILEAAGAKVVCDNDYQSLWDTIQQARAMATPQDIVLDLHFNAATPAATGTEVFHHANAAKQVIDYARVLSKSVAQTLGIRDRGAKNETQSQHNVLGILHTPAGVELLLETAFVTNVGDMSRYDTQKDAVAQAIADFLLDLPGVKPKPKRKTKTAAEEQKAPIETNESTLLSKNDDA